MFWLVLKVTHSKVLTLVEVMEDAQRLYLITPYMAGGELFNKIVARGHFTEADAVKTVRQVVVWYSNVVLTI